DQALVVAIDLLAPLVHLLGFKAQRRGGACVEPCQPDRLAGFLAIAVGALIDALERGVDLGDQLSLPVAGAQFQRPVAFRRGPVGHIWMIGALFLQIFQRRPAFAKDFVLPGIELSAEVIALARVHEFLVLGGTIVVSKGLNRHRKDSLPLATGAAYIVGTQGTGNWKLPQMLTSM